jgi:putative ABC transport system ATP-binding protein
MVNQPPPPAETAEAAPAPAPPATPPLIQTRQVCKIYQTESGPFHALRDVSVEIWAGEFVAIIGKSGSGKTTLMNVITGITRPSSGEVQIGDVAVHRLSEDQLARWRGQSVGVVFQFFQLLPTLTVLENVMLPMDFSGRVKPSQRRAKALRLLELVGMGQQGQKLPSKLSGGQQQRAAIARALANDPSLIVADEPTGNLDSQTAETVFSFFRTLVAEGKTVVMVTHDQDLAGRADRAIQIADGQVVQPDAAAQPHEARL